MKTRRWHLAAAVLLLALLAIVATLQYRWLGEVSTAEGERLRASLRTRGAEFTTAVDRDVTRAFSAFQIDRAAMDADAAAAVRDAAERASRESSTGGAVKAIFVAEIGATPSLRCFNSASGTLEPTSWPPELAPIETRLASLPAAVASLPLPPDVRGDALNGDVPAFVVPVSSVTGPPGIEPGHRLVVRSFETETRSRAVVVWLDLERLRTLVLAPLLARTFGDEATSEFDAEIVSTASGHQVFASSVRAIDRKTADLSVPVFSLRLEDLHWSVPTAAPPGEGAPPQRSVNQVAITIVRRGSGDADALFRSAQPTAAWTLLVQAKRGSLDAVVARSRTRNLAVSLGVLGVLGASLALILIASAREQRLARQQLEFVASVSHELRTPLAVIRSAGDNLADGVVSGDHVAEYGALIRNEGRRLSEMVERVMDYAGLSSGTLIRDLRETDAGIVVDAARTATLSEARDKGIEVRVRKPRTLPAVNADPTSLTSAIQNAIGNAVKYSQAGSVVEVDVASTSRRLRISVCDRGLGIDEADLSHVFEPFYRGRRAVESQARGSGVGLSVVQKIVEAHRGEVTIANREGGGTTLTIELPIVTSGTDGD